MPKASCALCHKTWTQEAIKMFHVPMNAEKRKIWSESCGVNLNPSAKICSLHFSSADYICSSDAKRVRLSGDALPITIETLSKWAETQATPSKFVNTSTQTESYEDCRVADLQIKIEELRAQVKELENLKSRISSIFTEGQIRKIIDPQKNVHWAWEDISSAIAIHAAGPRAYGHLCKSGFPFPCESTIRKWLQKMKVDDGVLNFSLNVMRAASDVPVVDKLCIMCFDEMKVQSIS